MNLRSGAGMKGQLQQSQRELEGSLTTLGMGLRSRCFYQYLRVNDAELAISTFPQGICGPPRVRDPPDEGLTGDITARLRRQQADRGLRARLRSKDGSVKDVMINANVLLEDGRFVQFALLQDANQNARRRADYLAAIVRRLRTPSMVHHFRRRWS